MASGMRQGFREHCTQGQLLIWVLRVALSYGLEWYQKMVPRGSEVEVNEGTLCVQEEVVHVTM